MNKAEALEATIRLQRDSFARGRFDIPAMSGPEARKALYVLSLQAEAAILAPLEKELAELKK